MPTTVNFDKGRRKIAALRQNIEFPMRDVLTSTARTGAIQLAKFVAPPGTGEDAKQKGEAATKRDIYKCYATPGYAWKDIYNKLAAGVFWKAFQAGEYDVAQQTLNMNGARLRGVPLQRFDGGNAHKKSRNTRGKVSVRSPFMIVINEKALYAYIKEEMSHVGTGKGGWADCVRTLGGTIRGLREKGDITANWITRKGVGFGSSIRGGTDQKPTIEIRNKVPYADQITDDNTKRFALAIAQQHMNESAIHINNHIAQKVKTAA